MAELDLNLLRVLVALGDERSVSGAAVRLGKSQPSVSGALGKLRRFFGDPLLIRSGNTMQPTPRALLLINAARAVLVHVHTEIEAVPSFDAASSARPFSLALSDVGEVVFLPAILKELRRLAPLAMVRSVSLSPAGVAQGLEDGSIDLAIGYFPDLKRHNFFQQGLFEGSFASLVRVDHPILRSKLTLTQFLQLDHAVVRAESRTEEVFERFLAKKRLRRNVVLTTPHFTSAPMIVAQLNLIVTIPEPLARYFSSVSARLRVVELPFRPPRIELKQFWHRRFHHDERNRWLRGLISKIFQRRGKSTADANVPP
jgi:DNA-binding transcriptional LysR family regulator